jgi:hypothetical protein
MGVLVMSSADAKWELDVQRQCNEGVRYPAPVPSGSSMINYTVIYSSSTGFYSSTADAGAAACLNLQVATPLLLGECWLHTIASSL